MAAKAPKDDKKDKEAPAAPTPEEQLAALQKKIKLSQILIVVAAVTSIGLGGGALAWAAVTASGVKNLEQEPANAINDKIDNLEKRLSTMFAKQDELQFKVDASYSALDEIREQREERDYGAIQKILIEQRTDYNDMLAILNTGVLALANMMRGTREWTVDYTRRIEQAIELNRKRIEAINDLPKHQNAKIGNKPSAVLPAKPPAAAPEKSGVEKPGVEKQ